MSVYKPGTWQEKLNIDKQPVVKKTAKAFAGIRTGQLMLIPTPKLVDAYIRQIPWGHSVSTSTLRIDLAHEFHAETTCPLTTGIFLRIAAEAADEQYRSGISLQKITPFWRIIDEKSPTAKKLSFGKAFLKDQRRKEGLE